LHVLKVQHGYVPTLFKWDKFMVESPLLEFVDHKNVNDKVHVI
jgi:hypothetical protein